MLLPEVVSILGSTTLSPFVTAIVLRTFETGLVFLSVMSLKDLLLCTTCGAVSTLE
jgi:hypothetical protein